MLVIGLDAASSLTKCGYAIGQWDGEWMRLQKVGLLETKDDNNVLNTELVPRLKEAEQALIAIDAPRVALSGLLSYAVGFDPDFKNSLIAKYGLITVQRASKGG